MSQFKPATGSKVVPDRRPMPQPERRATSVVVSAPRSPSVGNNPSEGAEEVPSTRGGIHTVALGTTLLFVFLRFSFLHEFVTAKIHFDTHLLLVIGVLAVLTALIGGDLPGAFSNRICLCWLAFGACMCLATATSIWRGGSFAVLFPFLRTTLLMVFLIPAVTLTAREISTALRIIGIAAVVPILLGLSSNDYRSGRLELSSAGSSIANSNDFAALLILVCPALAYWAWRPKSGILPKIIGSVALAAAPVLTLGTGSRGALVAMIALGTYLFFMSSGKVRVLIMLGVPIAALAVIPFLPAEASQRLASLFDSKEQTSEGAESKEQRQALLMASLRITGEHPLLGIGPSNFSIYEAQEAKDAGQRGMWHETHNSYTQISSECGIPALGFYLAGMFMSFAIFRRGRKSRDPDIRAVSTILALMFVGYAVCIFFLAKGYGYGFPVLGAFAIAIDRALKREAGQDLSQPSAIAAPSLTV